MAKRRIFDFEAVWWRGKMVLNGNTIEPQPPFEAYDPFQVYKPYGTGNRGEPRSVLFELLKVDPENTSDILRFCERFGVLGPPKELAGFDELAEDRVNIRRYRRRIRRLAAVNRGAEVPNFRRKPVTPDSSTSSE